MANWSDYFNPRAQYLKKTMFDLLKEKYSQNEQIIERLGSSLPTDGDLSSFMKMVSDIYEAAYMKAVNDHKEQLQKAGLVARIVPGKNS